MVSFHSEMQKLVPYRFTQSNSNLNNTISLEYVSLPV